MVGSVCRIGLLLLPLLEACGTGADFGDGADAAANGASLYASGAGVTTRDGGPDESPSVQSPCFRSSGAEAWTCNPDDGVLTRTRAGATETIECPYGCVPLPDGFDGQCRPRDGALGSTVNGHTMTALQASWVSRRSGITICCARTARPIANARSRSCGR